MSDQEQESVETLDPLEVEAQVVQIDAMDMQQDKLYVTYERRARYFCKLEKVEEDKNRVNIMAYYPQQAEWHNTNVPMRYKMKELTNEEQKAALEEITKTTKDVREIFAKYTAAKPRTPGEGRPQGSGSGLGMLACWGKFFKEFAHQEGQREKIKNAMLAEFPTKSESINRWLDAYRNYYNKGRLPGVEVPEAEIDKEEWLK